MFFGVVMGIETAKGIGEGRETLNEFTDNHYFLAVDIYG